MHKFSQKTLSLFGVLDITWLNALLDYSDKILILNDTDEVSQKLISLPVKDETKKTFEKFVTRFPGDFEAMHKWLGD